MTVDPTTFPEQRRGPSGPFASTDGPGSEFDPFDNERYLDPEYDPASTENGAINNPFLSYQAALTWIDGRTEGAKIHLPGYPITTVTAPITIGGNYVFEGVEAAQTASYLSTQVDFGGGGTTESLTFRNVYLEDLHMQVASESPLTFDRCIVAEVSVQSGQAFEGELYAYDTQLLNGDTPDSNIHVYQGLITNWRAQTMELTDCLVGFPESTAGALELTGISLVCRGVTFKAGTTIEFINSEGTVYLDPESYKSYLDNDIDAVNAVVERLDGSYPVNALTYASSGDITLNWFKNPRAYIEQTGHIDFDAFAPLTRYLTLIVDNQTSGEGFEEFTWWDGCVFSGGIPPEQEEGISVYIIEYEAQLSTYFVYVAGMNFLPETP